MLGALVITILPQLVIGFPGFQELVFGMLIVLVILFLPSGLAGLVPGRLPSLQQRFHHD